VKRIIRPAAKDDIMRQFRYYLVDRDLPDVANRFLEAIETTIGKILSAPNAGAPRPLSNEALVSLRSWPLSGESEAVYILHAGYRVAHQNGNAHLQDSSKANNSTFYWTLKGRWQWDG
jgi:plasmid stabilization system protein ParE